MAVIGSKPPEAQPFFEPPMAVIGSKPPEAILKSVILGGMYGQNYTLRTLFDSLGDRP